MNSNEVEEASAEFGSGVQIVSGPPDQLLRSRRRLAGRKVCAGGFVMSTLKTAIGVCRLKARWTHAAD
jgi:hypothetical protein